jgi:hypothetical protein
MFFGIAIGFCDWFYTALKIKQKRWESNGKIYGGEKFILARSLVATW